MNRIICILLSVMLFGTASFAQKKTDAAKQKPAKEQAATPAKEDKKMKKDGTPDMRYAENKKKKEEKPAGPTKKDGTPDMRYKANKEAAKKK